MCIIIAKRQGVEIPTKETLKECFTNNPDGSGIMFAYNSKVYIHKGMMTFNELDNYLEKLKKLFKDETLKNIPMVLHFRIKTHGLATPGNTHPFPITDKDENLTALDIACDAGVAHNGIISAYADHKNNLSDTQLFTRDCLSILKKYDNKFYKNDKINKVIETILGTSKLALLTPEHDLITYGKFIEDNGVLYSNDTYKRPKYKYYNYNAYYDEFYDRYYNYDYASYYSKKYNHSKKLTNIYQNESIKNDIKNKKNFDGRKYKDFSKYFYQLKHTDIYSDATCSFWKTGSNHYFIDAWDNLYKNTNGVLKLIHKNIRLFNKDYQEMNINLPVLI